MTAQPLDRPPGLAPRGTSWAMGLASVFAPGIPGFTAMAATPWLYPGSETGLLVAMIAVGVWLIYAVPMIIGFKARRYWGVVLFFGAVAYCALALPLALAFLGVLLLSTWGHQPPEASDLVFAVGLVAMVPFWPLLVRTLRLKYWQPWTRPDSWEAGDETVAGWVFDAAGVPRPPERARTPATRVPPRRRRG